MTRGLEGHWFDAVILIVDFKLEPFRRLGIDFDSLIPVQIVLFVNCLHL